MLAPIGIATLAALAVVAGNPVIGAGTNSRSGPPLDRYGWSSSFPGASGAHCRRLLFAQGRSDSGRRDTRSRDAISLEDCGDRR